MLWNWSFFFNLYTIILLLLMLLSLNNLLFFDGFLINVFILFIIQTSWLSDRQSILVWLLIRIRAYHRVRIITFLLSIYSFCFTDLMTKFIIQLDCLILCLFVGFYYLLFNRHNISWNFLTSFIIVIRCICIFNFIARKDWFLVLY